MHLHSCAFSHRRSSPWTADAYPRRRIPSPKALVRAGVVGAGGAEPPSSSVSAPTSHYRPASSAATLVTTSAGCCPSAASQTGPPRPSGPQSESPIASSRLPELKSRHPAVPLNRRLPLGTADARSRPLRHGPHFGPRIWLAGRRLMSMSAATTYGDAGRRTGSVGWADRGGPGDPEHPRRGGGPAMAPAGIARHRPCSAWVLSLGISGASARTAPDVQSAHFAPSVAGRYRA